eukprot:PhM_4_TR9204/c1_g1_i1/m.10870
MFVSHALAQDDEDLVGGVLSATSSSYSPKTRHNNKKANAAGKPNGNNSPSKSSTSPTRTVTGVGSGTHGLGSRCHNQMRVLSKEKFNEWRARKDAIGAGVGLNKPPPVVTPDYQAFYSRTKQHHQEVLSAVDVQRRQQAESFQRERKTIQTIVKSARSEQQEEKQRVVADEKTRRRLLREEALAEAEAAKLKAQEEGRAKEREDRSAWEGQRMADLEHQREVIARTRQQRELEREQSKRIREEHKQQRLAVVEAHRKTITAKRTMHKHLVEDNKEARKLEVQRLHDIETRSRAATHDTLIRKQQTVRDGVHSYKKELKDAMIDSAAAGYGHASVLNNPELLAEAERLAWQQQQHNHHHGGGGGEGDKDADDGTDQNNNTQQTIGGSNGASGGGGGLAKRNHYLTRQATHARVQDRLEALRQQKQRHVQQWKATRSEWQAMKARDREQEEEWSRHVVNEVKASVSPQRSQRTSPR